jgi:hypothetical protein
MSGIVKVLEERGAVTMTKIRASILAVLPIALLIILTSLTKAQQDTSSGNYFAAACKEIATGNIKSNDLFEAGMCAGEIEALSAVTPNLNLQQLRSCPPRTATRQQLAKVVMAYLDRHPEDLHHPLYLLIAIAFAGAWPCHNSN